MQRYIQCCINSKFFCNFFLKKIYYGDNQRLTDIKKARLSPRAQRNTHTQSNMIVCKHSFLTRCKDIYNVATFQLFSQLFSRETSFLYFILHFVNANAVFFDTCKIVFTQKILIYGLYRVLHALGKYNTLIIREFYCLYSCI